MKANESAKSKFVYPDKLYAICKNNKTLDVSYAPQNVEAVEYTLTDALIDKAIDLISNIKIKDYISSITSGVGIIQFDVDKLCNDLRKAMEE